MTVEQDGYDGEGTGVDPLLAVLMDEPLTDAARADAALVAEHRSAAADVALLREQLGIIAEALTEAPEEPAQAPAPPVRPRPRRRRTFALALGAVGVAAAGAMVVGLGWLLVRAGDGATESSGAAADSAQSDSSKAVGPLGSPEYLACARLVAEGEVTDTRPVPGTGEERVTLEVTRSYKPARSDADVTFAIPTSAGLDEGEQVLVAIPRDSVSPDFWLVGEAAIAAQRPLLIETLPQADATPCA